MENLWLGTKNGPRERILSTANELFFRYGYSAIGINRLIEESGVAKASFYYHFSTKESLAVTWLELRGEQWLQALQGRVDKADSLTGKINAMYSMWHDQLQDERWRGCGFINTAAEFSDENSAVRRVVRTHKMAVRDYIAKNVFQKYESEMSQADFDLLVDTVFSLFDGAIVQAQNLMDDLPLHNACKSSLLVIDSLLKKTDREGSRGLGA